MGMCNLENYGTGGTIHIVVNNQVGFTTDPSDSRSTPYCTDIAKAYNAPVFHVNGDDPEAVVRVCILAAEWRAQFKQDVVIDLVCYRKLGHNEIDEPSFTQPHLYKTIRARGSPLSVYQARLINEGAFTKEEVDAVSKEIMTSIEKAYVASKTYTPFPGHFLSTGSNWEGLKTCSDFSEPRVTGLSIDRLRAIGTAISTIPPEANMLDRLKGIYQKKADSIASGKGIDWSTAEALAFGSLLLEGTHVRLSGQDVRRGTFSHRHAVIFDQQTPKKTYTPLLNLGKSLGVEQAHITFSNSHLSEFGVLGFELGYSLENPHALVLWEGQFGDFFNGAQIIVDQFISSMEEKWLRQTGLVMLLPHGYEGQGPEHSSARMERFLQNSNDHPDVIPDRVQSRQIQKNNWQIANCTTPANYFHLLRRQVHRSFRKPLVVFSPKSLLRLPAASSTLEEMSGDRVFQPILKNIESGAYKSDAHITRVILCSGKVYYDLAEYRERHKLHDQVAILRVEQISPFPFHPLADELNRYPNVNICLSLTFIIHLNICMYI